MTPTALASPDWNTMSMEDVLELAITDENRARDYYRHAAAISGNLHTRRMLLNLSAMEQQHADLLGHELVELRVQKDLEAGMAD